ncbi:hypothetical protein ACMWQD_28445, partial [Escherichia coli]
AEVDRIEIEYVGAQGDGVGLAVGGARLFVPLTLPDEVVTARREKDRAELIEILRASPDRAAPPCLHFGACGGCQLQHWAMEPYTTWKV